LQQYERALADCKASITLNPRYSYAYNNLGTSLFGLGDIPNAIKAFTKAIELKPNFIYSRLSRAHAFVALEKNELARKDFAYVLTIDPTNGDAQTGLEGLPPPPETEKLKEARLFLEDVQNFVAAQTTVFPIPPIAKEAANLQLALNKFDEGGSTQSMEKLSDLLKSISGFEEFLQNREAERELEKSRRLTEAKGEGVKNVYFIDAYIKTKLGDSQTPSLMKLRQEIDESISKQAIEEIDKSNNSLQYYIKQNGLENSYQAIIKKFEKPGPAPVDTLDSLAKRVGATDKSMFLIQGPADDVVLIYNASPSAPKIWKNVRGDFVFQDDSASLCFTQSAPDVALVRYVERTLRHEGAKQVLSGPQPCDLSVTTSSMDIIAFQRGGLLKERENYIAVLVKLVEANTFRQYKIVTDYSGEKQRREALSLQIESDLERSVREGYGILAVSVSGTMCVVPPKDSEQMDGLRALITRDRDLIGPNLTSDWQFVETTDDLAFRGVQRHQCGFVAGDSAALRTVMEALRREQLKYSFAPVWFDIKEVIQATFDTRDTREIQIRIEEARKKAVEDAKRIEEQRRRDKQLQKGEIERQLREKNGARARGLMSDISAFVKSLAEKRDVDKNGSFSTYSTWLNKRFAEQWEKFNVTSDVDDFGTVQWNGRSLDAVIIKSNVQQRNRIIGKYEDKCFLFGLVDDVEFTIQRDSISAACDSGGKLINNWKVGKQFHSQWNVD
jgi:tetratricopeptide (TPR) repeat protein